MGQLWSKGRLTGEALSRSLGSHTVSGREELVIPSQLNGFLSPDPSQDSPRATYSTGSLQPGVPTFLSGMYHLAGRKKA